MNRNHLIGLAVVVAVLGILTFLAWRFLEIHPRQRWVSPSREARANEYLVLDRWLQGLGHPVRVVRSGNLSTISTAEERQIFIQASLFQWTPEAAAALARWIEEGGRLFLALDYQENWEFLSNTALLSLLGEFGIEARTGGPGGFRHNPELPFEEAAFGLRFSFEVAQNGDTLTLGYDTTRLVQVHRGTGSLTVSGRPFFLLSPNIGHAPNTRLAWAIFAAPDTTGALAANGQGWLFIRGTARTQGLLGTLFRHGNLAVVAVSALVLIAVGFWAVIPLFGLIRRDDERPEKPLRERFAAEGRFFKTYGALGFYRDAYIKEIRRRFAGKEEFSSDDELIERALNVLRVTSAEKEGRLLISAFRKEPIKYRDFPKMTAIFKTILERI